MFLKPNMKSQMHLASKLIAFFFILSCNNGAGKKQPPDNKTEVVDTPHQRTPETENAYAKVDLSPMDMSYFPVDYPKLKMATGKMPPPVMRVIYSRPTLQGRRLFKDLLKYDEPWRLGANEATEIHFYRNVTIQNKSVKAGSYILYCIPLKDEWTIVLNSDTDSWGLKQDTTKDVQRFKVPVTHHNPSLEYLTIVFEKTKTGANLILGWDEELAKLPINL